jgi:hypothetical protein
MLKWILALGWVPTFVLFLIMEHTVAREYATVVYWRNLAEQEHRIAVASSGDKERLWAQLLNQVAADCGPAKKWAQLKK